MHVATLALCLNSSEISMKGFSKRGSCSYHIIISQTKLFGIIIIISHNAVIAACHISYIP